MASILQDQRQGEKTPGSLDFLLLLHDNPTLSHRNLSLQSVQPIKVLGLTATECLHLCIPPGDEIPATLSAEFELGSAICSSGVPELARLRAACIVHTLLSLSTVPLECKPSMSHQRDVLGLHISVAVQVQFRGRH